MRTISQTARRRPAHLLEYGLLFAALVLLLVGVALNGPAMADEGSPEGCCVCACDNRATTSGAPRPSADSICIDASLVSCSAVCDLEGCGFGAFTPLECIAVEGCPQSAGRHMAPAASPFLLGGIASALAALGVYTVRRRSSS